MKPWVRLRGGVWSRVSSPVGQGVWKSGVCWIPVGEVGKIFNNMSWRWKIIPPHGSLVGESFFKINISRIRSLKFETMIYINYSRYTHLGFPLKGIKWNPRFNASRIELKTFTSSMQRPSSGRDLGDGHSFCWDYHPCRGAQKNPQQKKPKTVGFVGGEWFQGTVVYVPK